MSTYAQDVIDHIRANDKACLTTLRSLGDEYGYTTGQKNAVINYLVETDCIQVKKAGKRMDYTLSHPDYPRTIAEADDQANNPDAVRKVSAYSIDKALAGTLSAEAATSKAWSAAQKAIDSLPAEGRDDSFFLVLVHMREAAPTLPDHHLIGLLFEAADLGLIDMKYEIRINRR